jgi:hypothetical protein
MLLAGRQASKTSMWATGVNIAVSNVVENLNGTERLKFGMNDGSA